MAVTVLKYLQTKFS